MADHKDQKDHKSKTRAPAERRAFFATLADRAPAKASTRGQFKVERLNSQQVKAIPNLGGTNAPGEVKGADLFPEAYCNIALIGRKKAGKTSVILHIIQSCATKNTIVYAFASTIHKDNGWLVIKKYCEANEIPFVEYTGLAAEGKTTHLSAILEDMKTEKEEPKDEEEETYWETDGSEMVTAVKKKRVKAVKKAKYRELERLFIFDDLGGEITHKDIGKLLKTVRHWKAKTVISTQYCTDFAPDARRQVDYWCLFPNLSEKNLITLHASMGIDMTQEAFDNMYHQATNRPYQFLYCDVMNVQFRKNFSERLIVPHLEPDTAAAE